MTVSTGAPLLFEQPPPNPAGGRTLIVDAADSKAFARPSEALVQAGRDDLVFIRPGIYEDKIFVADRPVTLIGAGRDAVQVFNRRGGPLYLQRVLSGRISGITFRYVGSDQHSAVNIFDSACTISHCRAADGILSGVVLYGPECRVTFTDNEVRGNRESGIFVFGGACPRIADNLCVENHHFGLAVRDRGTHPEFVRNLCKENCLSGILLFCEAQALLLDNVCRDNHHWGVVMTPDCRTTPVCGELQNSNDLLSNPRGALQVTETPLADIGR